MNNSRYETLARERQAALVNRSMYDQGGNRNTNSMNTMDMDLRSTDSDRNTETGATPTPDRRRSSVSFNKEPDGRTVKLYDPEATLGNKNDKGPSEEPRRSTLKQTTESNAPLYDRPGNQIQLSDSNMMNPAEQRRRNDMQPSKERFASKMQLFDNPTKTLQPYETSMLSGVDIRPAGYDQNTGLVKSYKDQVLVEVKVVFVRIIDIDTVNQQFDAEMYIQARWPESQFAGYTEEQLQEIDFAQCWNPMLTILNIVGLLENDRASMLLRYEPDRVYPILTYMWHVKGFFREILELQHFPFDVQEVSVVISSERSIRELELVRDFTQLSNVSPRAMQGNQEWTAYRHVEFTRDYNTLETVSLTKHPILKAAAHVKRKMGLYFWNVFIIVLLILALSFTTLGMPPVSEDRLMLTATLFLTAIAFKLVVKATLPNISYLTYLDMYVLFSLVYLTLQGLENATMIHLRKFKSLNKIEVYDEISQGCLIALLIIFHLTFLIYIQVTAFSRRRSMGDKELDFELAKYNLKRKEQENMAGKEKGELAGIDARTGMPRGNENPLFMQPQTMGNQQQPMEVNNPLFMQPQTMGNQQQPMEVNNPLFRQQ
ncbi:hypothetical protein BsWGS_01327 [Bradybaena similaris]